jgi:protein-S-isoprenylcysteine O-methyltransferase Ste14
MHLGRRPLLQGIGYGAWLLFFVPAGVSERAGLNFASVAQGSLHSWMLYPLGFLLLLGLAAVHEFAAVGGGPPIPFDPLRRLVTTGPYAYLANPMQVTSIGVLLLLAAAFRLWELAAVAASFYVYSIGLVRWHHRTDIAQRFGVDWQAYRAAVPDWRPRWRPYVSGPATLTVGESCFSCQKFAGWIRRRRPRGLDIVLGQRSSSPGITYRHVDAEIDETGIAAVARALEHINFAFAFVGWALRLLRASIRPIIA